MIDTPIRQEGNKKFYLAELYSLFPAHEILIEPFCGTGVVSLNSPAKIKFLNDHNKWIYWTYKVLSTKRGKDKLVEIIRRIPCYTPFLAEPYDSLTKEVARRILLSSVGLLGSSSVKNTTSDSKQAVIDLVNGFEVKFLEKTKIYCMDFRKFLKMMPGDSFVYCDPPYVFERGGLKSNRGFKEKDLNDLFEILCSKNWKFAISCREKSANFWAEKGLKIVHLSKTKVGFNTAVGKESEFLAINYSIQKELFDEI